MKNLMIASAMVLSVSSCQNSKHVDDTSNKKITDTTSVRALEEVFADSTYQLTGVAVSDKGRIFTNYPYWLDTHKFSVVEIKNGNAIPFPDKIWNSFSKGESGQNKFVCVQSVVADDKGYLWVVDAAGIGLSSVYRKSNKVVKINLSTNKIERIYRFAQNIAGSEVYLNDIRIDNVNGFAYLTNSSQGGIIVLNIHTGDTRYLLGEHFSVQSDKGYKFSPDGAELLKGDGKALKVNSDGIALSPDNNWLYYKPLTDDKLYRIKTSLLRDFSTPLEIVAGSVKDLGHFVTTDGMIFDKAGNLYMGDLETSSIVEVSPTLKMRTLITDKDRLIWPDSYSISQDGYLYISISQIQRMSWFNRNTDKIQRPFRIYKLKL